MFYSQSGQDEWVVKLLNNKENGYFLDIGAYDGVESSNTAHLERELNWSGINIEANSHAFGRLVHNRSTINIYSAVSDYNGTCFFSGDSIAEQGEEVVCKKLTTILEQYNAPKYIDYLSIDVEGHEYTILKDFDFATWTIGLMTVEHNLYCWGSENKDRLYELLTSRGFIRVVEDAPCLDTNPLYYQQPYEDWYVNSTLLEKVNL